VKLFTRSGASSLSVHILLREIGEPFQLEVVNVTTTPRAYGSDYRAAEPRGKVPLLVLDDGEELTDNLLIAQYLCDRARRYDLMPATGTQRRYRVMEWQSFVAAELDKNFMPLTRRPEGPVRELALLRIQEWLAVVERELTGPYLTGCSFTAADAYFFVIASWARHFRIPLHAYPRIEALLDLIGERASVRDALAAEALSRGHWLAEENPQAVAGARAAFAR
jgi:glutathione S-transferase